MEFSLVFSYTTRQSVGILNYSKRKFPSRFNASLQIRTLEAWCKIQTLHLELSGQAHFNGRESDVSLNPECDHL
jgi:hypothetical protein